VSGGKWNKGLTAAVAAVFVWIISVLVVVRADPEVMLSLIIDAAEMPPGGRVYVCGYSEATGSWSPSTIEMTKTDTLTWSIDLLYKKGSTDEFTFTAGSWETRALFSKTEPVLNFGIKLNSDTTLRIHIPYWKSSADTAVLYNGGIKGDVRYHSGITYPGLLPHNVQVWLPPGYDSVDESYPVIYIQDGQNVFNPAESTLGFDWRADEIADSLISAGKMRNIIIAAVENTYERMQEYTIGGKADLYRKFITHKLKPMIDSLYRTMPQREFTAAAGSSVGAIAAARLVFEESGVFGKLAAFSPSFKIGEIDYTEVVKSLALNPELFSIYIDIGEIGIEESLTEGALLMNEVLTNKGFTPGKNLLFNKIPLAMHNEAAWSQRLHIPLLKFFGKQ